MGFRTYPSQQPLPHGRSAGIRKCQAQNILRPCVGAEQDIADPCGEEVRFSSTRPGYHQYRPFHLIYSLALGKVQGVEKGQESLVALLEVGHKCWLNPAG